VRSEFGPFRFLPNQFQRLLENVRAVHAVVPIGKVCTPPARLADHALTTEGSSFTTVYALHNLMGVSGVIEQCTFLSVSTITQRTWDTISSCEQNRANPIEASSPILAKALNKVLPRVHPHCPTHTNTTSVMGVSEGVSEGGLLTPTGLPRLYSLRNFIGENVRRVLGSRIRPHGFAHCGFRYLPQAPVCSLL
jgi:hypothetical protein